MRSPIAFALGAATAFFFDPDQGTRRRHEARDRALAAVRRASGAAVGKAKHAAGQAQGLAAEARQAIVEPDVATDDETVRQRILSDALRDVLPAQADARQSIDVEVQQGIATLRGPVPSAGLADELVARVREVPGVRAVSHQLTVASDG